MNYQQARTRLNCWTNYFDNKDASTNKRVELQPRLEVTEEWYREHDGTAPDWRSPRTVAYLCAYLEIAGGPIPLAGIRLEDGYLLPDRAVIRTLLNHNFLYCESEALQLTELGEALIAPLFKLTPTGIRVMLSP
jgi:hypothetical protein